MMNIKIHPCCRIQTACTDHLRPLSQLIQALFYIHQLGFSQLILVCCSHLSIMASHVTAVGNTKSVRQLGPWTTPGTDSIIWVMYRWYPHNLQNSLQVFATTVLPSRHDSSSVCEQQSKTSHSIHWKEVKGHQAG